MTTRTAWGHGLATVVTLGPAAGTVLDVRFPEPHLGLPPTPDPLRRPDETRSALDMLAGDDEARGVRTEVRTVVVDLDVAPADTADAYLRLHLLSHRLVAPHGLALDGIFGVLPTVVWTDRGPCAQDGFEAARLRIRAVTGTFPVVHAVDKFPRMVDYVLPGGVRVADGARVRLGAHLAEGTTVMHEGFVNFNAGTLGASMVEGRISAGVVVGDGSDIGGGASIMGTLSGGGRETITVGRRSLLGANAGLGIPLGDDCVVEAGLYLTAGTKVRLDAVLTAELRDEGVLRPPADPAVPEERAAVPDERAAVPARALAGRPGVLFRRHSLTGEVEAISRAGAGVTLNPDLHA